MTIRSAVVAVPTSGVFRLDLRRIQEIMRTRGFDCEVRRKGTVVVADSDTISPNMHCPFLICLRASIDKQLGEAGLVRRDLAVPGRLPKP